MVHHPFLCDESEDPQKITERELNQLRGEKEKNQKGGAMTTPKKKSEPRQRSSKGTTAAATAPRQAKRPRQDDEDRPQSLVQDPFATQKDDDETQDMPVAATGSKRHAAAVRSPSWRAKAQVIDESPMPRLPPGLNPPTPNPNDNPEVGVVTSTKAPRPGAPGTAQRTAARPLQKLAAQAALPLETPAGALTLRITDDEPVTATQELAGERNYPMPSPPPLFSLGSVSQARPGKIEETKDVWEKRMNAYFAKIDHRSLNVAEE